MDSKFPFNIPATEFILLDNNSETKPCTLYHIYFSYHFHSGCNYFSAAFPLQETQQICQVRETKF